ncbi:copper fist DNA binding domain-containing protein [Sporodiniella umbellata]|nr:copper fist DNA binding domain-containing protein [Sporodiniella umbellata]
MVLIKQENGIAKKFACLKCIKGHRSSKCEHSDRELIEIRRKGRPVSQCESCRHLRKMKQVHIKCVCASKLDSCLENHTAGKKKKKKKTLI